MTASTNDTTRLKGNLAIGSAVTAGLLSVATAASVFLGGNTYTDKAQNAAPAQLLGSGAYTAYYEQPCVSTGGQVGVVSTTATAVIPLSSITSISGSGVLTAVGLDVFTNPTAAKFDIGAVKSLTASGNTLDNIAVVSGATINRPVNDIVIPQGGYIRALATSNFTGRCMLKVYVRQYTINPS